MKILFGNIGVCVGGYTKESIYTLLAEHSLEALLMDNPHLRDSNIIAKDMYLQSRSLGPYKEDNTVSVYGGFAHFVTDMENFLHILLVGILDPDAANSLIDELYSQGLIKPREGS